MPFFDSLSKLSSLINKSVGNNLDNEEEDVRTIRQSFEEIEVTKPENSETDYTGKPLGIITKSLDTDIKKFQQENDLRVDGYITPKGETEQTLIKKLKTKKENQHPFALADKEEIKTEAPSPFLGVLGQKISREQIQNAFSRIKEEETTPPLSLEAQERKNKEPVATAEEPLTDSQESALKALEKYKEKNIINLIDF